MSQLEGASPIRFLEIIVPDDFHHHLRDDSGSSVTSVAGNDSESNPLRDVLRIVSRKFARILVMPNIKPPVKTLADALQYKSRILSQLNSISDINSKDEHFTEFLMTLYLTDTTTSEDIFTAKQSGVVYACKLYPAGATTNSEFGVTSLEHIFPCLQAMADIGLPLCVHGEVVDPAIDIFDREKVFIDKVLRPLVDRFPTLKVIMEHITTQDAVEFVSSCGSNVAATITAHHLLYSRNDIFRGGVCPHMYCLPILKRESHRIALLQAATSGNPKFFIGTDSAPHNQSAKESGCGCAGIFTGHAAIELYAEAFDSCNALDKLENFTSVYGAQFYNLPVLSDRPKVKLVKESWQVPSSYPFGRDQVVIPLRADDKIAWRILS